MRWIPAAVFFASAIFVAWYNANHDDKYYLAYVIDWIVPQSKGNVVEQGEYTVLLLGAMGIFFLFRDLLVHYREKFHAIDQDE